MIKAIGNHDILGSNPTFPEILFAQFIDLSEEF